MWSSKLRRVSALAVAVFLFPHLGACAPAETSHPDPSAVAKSLIDATTTICVPYVADGTPPEQLVKGPGLAKRVDQVRGQEVTRYVVDTPGAPIVTLSPQKDFGVGPDGERDISSASCWMQVPSDRAFARQVVSRFRGGLALSGYRTTPPHDVEMWGVLRTGAPIVLPTLCVHGRGDALVTVSSPDFKFEGPNGNVFNHLAGEPKEIEVHVESDPVILESEGCIPVPASALVPTRAQAESACMGLPGIPLGQQVEGCTVVITSRDDPDQDWAHYENRGEAYDSERRHDLAIQDFEAALRLKPDDGAARAGLAKAKRALGAASK